MIKIEKLTLHDSTLIPAIRGMRNPMNSWEKSDSYNGFDCTACGHIERDGICSPGDPEREHCYKYYGFELGKNDLSLMQRLVNAGTDHSKFMRMITVSMDITAPLYWWKEFDTYKIGVVRNSCSTMHKIHTKPFTTNDFSCDDPENIKCIVEACEELRKTYLKTQDKKYWIALIQLLPESYNQKATVMLNFQVLRNMYHARKNHKLSEWLTFCHIIKEYLPYSELITMED